MRAFFGAAVGLCAGGYFNSTRGATPTSTATIECYNGQVDPLSPKEFRPFACVSQYDESPDTKVLRFALPEGDMTLGAKCASCVVLRYTNDEGKDIIRPYTPISGLGQTGYFEILIKKYPGAQMGTHLFNLKKSQTIDVKGPFEKIAVTTNKWKRIGLIAGGTGVAPCYQVAQHVLKDQKDTTEVSMILANKTKSDMLLGNEINKLMETYPRFSPYFVLSNPHSTWMGGMGHVNKEMIKAFMPAASMPSGESIIMVSGPPAMMDSICGDKDFSSGAPQQGELKGLLKQMGYSSKQVFKF